MLIGKVACLVLCKSSLLLITVPRMSSSCFLLAVVIGLIKMQGCRSDFKLPVKYNKQAGNQTAKDFFQFYFSSIFQWKQPGATLVVARENPQAPALNDSPAYVAVSRLCRLLEVNPDRASFMDTIWCSTVLNGVCQKEKLTVKCGLYMYCLIYLFPRCFPPKWAKWDLTFVPLDTD